MQRLTDYVEHLRRKPLHEREHIARFSAGAIVAVVAVGYLIGLSASDRLTLNSASQTNQAPSATQPRFSDLAGAAAALTKSLDAGEITVVESKSSSTMEPTDTGSATVIPF